jgi:hypothetical protein
VFQDEQAICNLDEVSIQICDSQLRSVDEIMDRVVVLRLSFGWRNLHHCRGLGRRYPLIKDVSF